MKKILCLCLYLNSLFVSAHPMPNSVVALHIKEQNIEAILQIPLSELEPAFGKPLNDTLIKIEQDWSNGLHAETQPLEVGVVAWDIPSNTILPFQVNFSEGSLWKGFKSMFQLGMSHIFEGTDHLLFLLVLLLPAPLLVENRFNPKNKC